MDFSALRGRRALLFDFGGTLDSDGEHWFDRFRSLYSEAGLNIPPDDVKAAFYRADALCSGDPEVAVMGLRALMARHVRLQFEALGLKDDARQTRLVEGFCEKSERYLMRNKGILQRLKGRYLTGVVSNFYGNVAELCREAGLTRSLDVVLDSSVLGVGKPDPAIFRIALKTLCVAPQEAVFIGDSYDRDVIPAREVGMEAVWLKGPNPRIPPHAGPVDEWISSLTELEAFLS